MITAPLSATLSTTEACLKYFLIQDLASSTLLFIIISKSVLENLFTLNIYFTNFIITIPLLIKTGAESS